MSINAKARMGGLTTFCVMALVHSIIGKRDEKDKEKVNRGTLDGVVKLRVEPSMSELAQAAKKLASADKVSEASVKTGLLDDIGAWQMDTSIVKIGKTEMSGRAWFDGLNAKAIEKNPKAKEMKTREFRKLFAKLSEKEIVKRGVEWQIPAALLASGKQGKKKQNPLDYLNDII